MQPRLLFWMVGGLCVLLVTPAIWCAEREASPDRPQALVAMTEPGSKPVPTTVTPPATPKAVAKRFKDCLSAIQVDFPLRAARYVRVNGRNHRADPVVLSEIEVFGSDRRQNLARATSGAKAGASSHETILKKTHVSFLNDGRFDTVWSSERKYGVGPPSSAWIEIELPKMEQIASVRVYSDPDNALHGEKSALASVSVFTSQDGNTWEIAGEKTPESVLADRNEQEPARSLSASFLREAMLQADPIAAALQQYRDMCGRFERRGIDVTAEMQTLADLEKQVLSFDPAIAGPSEALSLLVKIRLAKRNVLFRDPDLEAIQRLLFVKRHPYQPSHNYTDFSDGRLKGGGGIFVLDLPRVDGRLRPETATLTLLFDAKAGIARDVTLDPDATTIWFAYMPSPERGQGGRKLPGTPDVPETRRWHLYRTPATGGAAEQVTRGPYQDYYPCILPDGDIAFVTSRCDRRFICFIPTSMTLYRMHPDGSGIRPISDNNLSEWGPVVRNDGRIMWTRSEYLDKGANYGHTLWSIRPDGTHCELVYGNNTRHSLMNAREVPGNDGELCATLISHFGDFNGPIAYVRPSLGPSNPNAVQIITPDLVSMSPVGNAGNGGRFRDPWPISRDLVLVSHDQERLRFALFLIDRFGNRELLYEDSGIGCMTPVPLRPRSRPPLLPDVSSCEPARMTVMDVYQGLGPAVPRGSVKWLRICRELPAVLPVRSDGTRQESTSGGFRDYYAGPWDVGPVGYIAKSVIGVVPVEADGSASFEVPTGVMFYFQALDQDYNEIQRMRSIIQARPGEKRTCIGCHEDRVKAASPRSAVLALQRAPSRPIAPSWGGGPFWYEKVVQPALDRACVRCHDGTGASDSQKINLTAKLDKQVPASYRTLVRGGYVHYFNMDYGALHHVATPMEFGVMKSTLFQILKDKQHEKVILSPEDMQAIKCWIDLNCPLWGDYQNRNTRCADNTCPK